MMTPVSSTRAGEHGGRPAPGWRQRARAGQTCPSKRAPQQPQIGKAKDEGDEPAAVVASIQRLDRALYTLKSRG